MVNILASTPTDDNGHVDNVLFVVVNVFIVHQLEKVVLEEIPNDIVPLCH